MSKVSVKEVTNKIVTIELTEQEALDLNAALEYTYPKVVNESTTLAALSIALDDADIRADNYLLAASEEDLEEEDSY